MAGNAADQELGSLRMRVANAGIAVVVAYEKQKGRHPKVMPPNHKGYDIESSDACGQVIRYIEVKALSGSWGSDGVGLTAPEFEKASACGATYWLYVVEYADTGEAELHAICDPARTVTHFFFDHGWRAASGALEEHAPGAAEQESVHTESPSGDEFAGRDD
jgi:hypothetical protein